MPSNTTVVLVKPEDFEHLTRCEPPFVEFMRIDWEGLDLRLALSSLRELLGMRQAKSPPIRAHGEPVGPFFFDVPEAVLRRLLALPTDETRATAERWGQTEDFTMNRMDGEHALSVVEGLRALTRRREELRDEGAYQLIGATYLTGIALDAAKKVPQGWRFPGGSLRSPRIPAR